MKTAFRCAKRLRVAGILVIVLHVEISAGTALFLEFCVGLFMIYEIGVAGSLFR